MNLLAALLIADSVRARIEQGDCPTEPQQPRELVEESLCELQRAIARNAVAIEFVTLKARRDALTEVNAKLAAALDECATRFERCCVHGGSDKEFAAHAVEDYRAVVKAAKAGA